MLYSLLVSVINDTTHKSHLTHSRYITAVRPDVLLTSTQGAQAEGSLLSLHDAHTALTLIDRVDLLHRPTSLDLDADRTFPYSIRYIPELFHASHVMS